MSQIKFRSYFRLTGKRVKHNLQKTYAILVYGHVDIEYCLQIYM